MQSAADDESRRALEFANEEPAGLLRALHLFWRAPEDRLVQVGAEGELTLARIRLVLLGGLLVFALYSHWTQPPAASLSAHLGLAGVAVLAAIVIYQRVKHTLYYGSWLAFATSVFDVVLISAALALYLVTGEPHHAVNSSILFSLYLLALAGTSIRLDHRVSAFTALVAFACYLFIVQLAAYGYGLAGGPLGPSAVDAFSWSDQIGRLAVVASAGILSTLVVLGAQRLRQLSATDALTGLMNRRAFEERLTEELARARRYGRPVSVAMIDIDYFKNFNDTYGHAAGDDCLRNVAATLRSRLRTGDMVARYGGEEFTVILPETSAQTAVATAELLRRAVAASPLRITGQREPVPVTVSIGVASWPERGQEISRLQERADDRLYQAKLAGRDQVVGPLTAVSG